MGYGGAMGQIFWWIGLVEILGSIPAINYTMNGGDREPGDYAFDPLGFIASATPAQKEEMQLKELKNGRLAMMAFSHRDAGGARPPQLPLRLDGGAHGQSIEARIRDTMSPLRRVCAAPVHARVGLPRPNADGGQFTRRCFGYVRCTRVCLCRGVKFHRVPIKN